MDTASLLPGVKWRPAIRKAIREANYFLALISNNSSQGRGVRNSELNQALEILSEFPPEEIFVIPARLDECQMPRDELLELTWVDLFPQWEAGIEKILRVIAPGALTAPQSHMSQEPQNPTTRYHYRVGLVDLDIGLTNQLSIAQGLNRIQSFFHFMCPRMPALKNAIETIGGLTNSPSQNASQHR